MTLVTTLCWWLLQCKKSVTNISSHLHLKLVNNKNCFQHPSPTSMLHQITKLLYLIQNFWSRTLTGVSSWRNWTVFDRAIRAYTRKCFLRRRDYSYSCNDVVSTANRSCMVLDIKSMVKSYPYQMRFFSICLLDSNMDRVLFQLYIQMSRCNVRVDRTDLLHSGTKMTKWLHTAP